MNIKEIDPSNSILFLGSGFSQQAINITDENLPAGANLSKKFGEIAELDYRDYSFQTLSDEVAEKHNMYELLYELFTVKSLSKSQKEILKLPWQRIYTTNYDQVAEIGIRQVGRKVSSFVHTDVMPNKVPHNSVVHLHGSVAKMSQENVLDEIILNEHSYVRQHFDKTQWYDEFVRDYRFCVNCFFIGYSLNDYHITALLGPLSNIKNKTYFINRSVDNVFSRRVKDYGYVCPIGIDGFAEQCKTLPIKDNTADPYRLKSFEYYDTHKDKKSLSKPTSMEIRNLVTYGTFNLQRCISSLPGNSYVLPRREHVKYAIKSLQNVKTLLVHSRLGNGKTIFLNILGFMLSEQGYRCFWCKELSTKFKQEVSALADLDRVIIFFDSYDLALEVITVLASDLNDAKFVIAIRSGVQDSRLHEIQDRLPSPMDRLNLNGLLDTERDDFIDILDDAGLLTRELRNEIYRCDDIREVVTSFYKHSGINDKLRSELKPITSNPNLNSAMVCIHLLNVAGLRPDISFLKAVSRADAYALASKFRYIASEIVHFDNDELRAHSSIFSEYLAENFFDQNIVVECINNIIVEAVERKRNRPYRAVLSYFMKVSNLKKLVRGGDQSRDLNMLFDRLRRYEKVNSEPLFWLQYSILMMDINEYDISMKYVNTAYDRANALDGFKTYQLDTHALKVVLKLEANNAKEGSLERFDKIIDCLGRVSSMLGDASHRLYVIRALWELKPFIEARISSMSSSEKIALKVYVDMILKNLIEIEAHEESFYEAQNTYADLRSLPDLLQS